MNRADNLLTELHRLTSLQDNERNADAHLKELIAAAARLLRARSCTFLWLSDEHGIPDHELELGTLSEAGALAADAVFKRVTVDGEAKLIRDDAREAELIRDDAGADESEGSRSGDDHKLCSPIRHSGRVIGMIHVSGPMDRPQFDHDDVRMLHIVTVYIGKSLQVAQLQNLLHSRFAQLALASEVDHTVGQVLAAAPNPAGIVKILAKSFYREMTRMGFGANEIVNAASQIISELSGSLRRHARRQEGAAA